MQGRKPKPTALRIIQGNAGKRPLPKNEPKPPQKAPRAPKYLSEEQKKTFRILARRLDAAKIITELDATALEMLCVAYAQWREATEKVDLAGLVVKTVKGNPIQNPYLSIANGAYGRLHKLLVEFGMTPSSRTGVQTIGKDKKAADVYDKYS